MRILQATALACLCALAPTATVKSIDPAVPEWDAKYVKMEVPKTVRASQVFAVAITMKNTGTQIWREGRDITPSSLRSQAAYGNFTWGTNCIIQAQGTSVEPGQEFTYKSYLRAPNKPGKYAFQWQLHAAPGLFGQMSARVVITVGAPADVNDDPPPIPKPDRTGKRPLTFADFVYLGSFKLPDRVGNASAAVSESGLALRKYPDGTERLLVNYTYPEGALFEVDIPDHRKLGKFEEGDASELQTAEAKKVWGALAQNDVGANGGLCWDENKQTLYWTSYHGYWTGGDLPVLQATKLNDDGTLTPVGSWTVPQQKWHWGGVTRLPKSFADRYTDGKSLAMGFGGYYSVVGPCSRGPALGTIADPDPTKGKVDRIVNLLGYQDPEAAPRPGNYFNANCLYWNQQPRSHAAGTWTYCDECRNGVMIDLEDKQGYIAFVKLGTGRVGYDYGQITSAGAAQYWYFYDTRHLGQAARGDCEPGDVVPYRIRLDRGMGGGVTGSCFDAERRKLYVIRMQSYKSDRESFPLVHVYHVKKN